MATSSVTSYLIPPTQQTIGQLHLHSQAWDAAAKITLAAIFIIPATAAVLTATAIPIGCSVGFIALTTGTALSIPLLFGAEQTFAKKSQHLKSETFIETEVLKQMNYMQHWTWDNDYIAFYSKHQIQLPAGVVNGKIEIKSYYSKIIRPLIARFKYWEDINNPCNGAEWQANYCLQSLDASIRYRGWDILKKIVLPAKLEQAITLHLIEHIHQNITLEQIGRCRSQKRTNAEQQYTDPYFEFADGRPALTIQDILEATPKQLSNRLFTH